MCFAIGSITQKILAIIEQNRLLCLRRLHQIEIGGCKKNLKKKQLQCLQDVEIPYSADMEISMAKF